MGITAPLLIFLSSINLVPDFTDSLNVILISVVVFTFLLLFVGLVEFMVGGVPSVVNLSEVTARGLFDWSVMLPVWMDMVYLVPGVRVFVGFMVKMLLLIVLAVGIVVPLLFLRSIHMVPSFMGSLNVTLISLLVFTFCALLVGLLEVMLGAVVSSVDDAAETDPTLKINTTPKNTSDKSTFLFIIKPH